MSKVSPDYLRGVTDAMTIAANIAQKMMDQRDLDAQAVFHISALRDGYAAAALMTELDRKDHDADSA